MILQRTDMVNMPGGQYSTWIQGEEIGTRSCSTIHSGGDLPDRGTEPVSSIVYPEGSQYKSMITGVHVTTLAKMQCVTIRHIK